MLTTLLFLMATAADPVPEIASDPDLMALARRQRTNGWIEMGAGAGLVGGGLALMMAGRPSGAVSNEDPTLHDLRTVSGIAATLGGITTLLVAGNTLSRAADTRREATLSVSPEPIARGAGLRLTAHF